MTRKYFLTLFAALFVPKPKIDPWIFAAEYDLPAFGPDPIFDEIDLSAMPEIYRTNGRKLAEAVDRDVMKEFG